MADSFIQLTTDGAGKQLDTVIVNMGVGSTQVHREKMVLADPLSTSAFATVTSSAGLLANLSSGTVTSTAATNPWSSAPGFNLPMVSASSGLVQLSGIPTVMVASSAGLTQTVTILSASSGLVQISGTIVSASSGFVQISGIPTVTATAGTNPWSSAPGFNVPVVSVSSGLIQISGTPTVTATAATNPWSSAPGFNLPTVSVSSGFVQISGIPTVTATAATNPWSSAPGFNLPVVSVSSGLIQALPGAAVTSGLAILSTWFQSTGGAASVLVNTSAGNWLGYALFNSTATIRACKVYNTSSAPGVGTTSNILSILMAPGSTGGGGANILFPLPGVYSSRGLGFTMTGNIGATDTGAPGANDLTLTLYFV